MADKLRIYQGAARLLGYTAGVASLTENNVLRYKLDEAWDDAVEMVLSQGFWNFAIREAEIDKEVGYDPDWGYDYQFTKPTDWVRTVAISDNGDFQGGFEQYLDQTDYWYAGIDPLYVRYVSNDASYGTNVTKWDQPFAKCMEAYLAFECSLGVAGGSRQLQSDTYSLYKARLKDAKTLDAIDERVKYRPAGRLVRSRLASRNLKHG